MTNIEKEISHMAQKAAEMKESSLRMLIFATDILLARDQIEREREESEALGVD